jgi:hypothetical protein
LDGPVAAQLEFMSFLVFFCFFSSFLSVYKGEINAATSLVSARALQESFPRGLTAFFFSSKSACVWIGGIPKEFHRNGKPVFC